MAKQTNPLKVKFVSDLSEFSPLGQRITHAGQKAARKAIASHKALGNPIYYKENDQLIKELADGTRYLVKASAVHGITSLRKL